MFGNRESILDIIPTFYLDYREVEEIHNPSLRWKARITSMDDNLIGNIWNFFDVIVNRLTSDIDVPFELNEKMMRIENTSVHESVREALVNCLIHFQIEESGSIVIEKGEKYFKFSNPGNMRIPVEEAFKGGESDPRNPLLHQMFSYLGYGERAGSGLYNINAIWNEKGWKSPEIKERLNPDRTTLVLSKEKKENEFSNITKNEGVILNSTENQILKLIKQDSNITQLELASQIGITERAISKVIKELKGKNIITRIGSNKTGFWKINL